MKKRLFVPSFAILALLPALVFAVGGCGGRGAPQAVPVKAASVYETDGVAVDPSGITCRERGEPVAEFPVASRQDWSVGNFSGRLTIEPGRIFNGVPTLYVGGSTSKCDTAWNATSRRIMLPKGLRHCQVEMRIYSDPMLATTVRPLARPDEKWQNAVIWYDAAGKEILTGPFPYYAAGGGRFSDVNVPLTVPEGSAALALRLGFDSPNVGPGEKVAFAKLVLAAIGPVKRYVKEGSFVSEVQAGGKIAWEAQTPPGTSIQFQWRGAEKAKDLFAAKFRGPDGTAESYYSRPFAAEAPFIQYRCVLVSEGTATPILERVTVGRAVDGRWTDLVDDQPPEVWRAMPSPTTDPHVRLAFAIRDRSAVDWESVKVRVDGQDVTAAFAREGDVIREKAPRAEAYTNGIHWAEIDVADCRGQTVTAKKLFFIGEPPKEMPQHTLRDDGITLIDGKPFFPIGLYAVCAREFNGMSLDNAFKGLKEAGFNFAQTYGKSYGPGFFEAAAKYGVKLWVGSRFPDEKFMKRGRFVPEILAWYLGDDTSGHETPQELRDYHDAVKAIDPTRLTCQADGIGAANKISSYARYVTGTDVYMPEIYPIRQQEGDVSDTNCVAVVIRSMAQIKRDVADYGDGRVRGCWPILQWFKGWGNWHHFPTRQQLFATSFAAIIHGGHGITWYTYGGFYDKKRKKYNEGVTSTPERWQTISELASWFKELTPALVARGGTQPPAEIVSGASRDPLGQPSVTALLKRCGGEVFLLTVNAAPEKVRARFRIDDVTGKVEVMRENRSVTCTNGVLEDDFEPLGVHVYRCRFSKKP